jgi:purine catabolism regulator
LGWDLLNKRVVAIIDLNSFEQYYLAHIERGEAYFQQIKERFLHAVTQAALERNPLSILVDRSDSIVLLPHFQEDTPPSQARREVQALAEAINERAQEQLEGLSISIAIGGFYGSVEGLRHSYNEARAALRVGSQMARRGPIIWYDDVALYVFLNRFAAQPEVLRWYEQTIGPLLEYDHSHSTELVKTLEAYFDANQTLQQAARQLFIHPKTLKYRLQRIEEILGTDPFLGDKQLNFYLATKIASFV